MKPTIYFLDDKNGSGKPRLINGLIKELMKEPKQNDVIFFPNDLMNDVLCVMEIGGTKIGMMSHENPSQSPSNLLNFFSDKGCTAIFCTSIQPASLNKAVSNLVAGGMVQSVYLKSIWSPNFEVEGLLEYEISKLIEIISVHTDHKFLSTDLADENRTLKVG